MSRRYVLECADGTVWDFNDPACPVSFRTEPTGTEGAEFTHDDQKNVGQAGVSWVARNDMPNFIGLDCKVGLSRRLTRCGSGSCGGTHWAAAKKSTPSGRSPKLVARNSST